VSIPSAAGPGSRLCCVSGFSADAPASSCGVLTGARPRSVLHRLPWKSRRKELRFHARSHVLLREAVVRKRVSPAQFLVPW
jgi:hypothetical protein